MSADNKTLQDADAIREALALAWSIGRSGESFSDQAYKRVEEALYAVSRLAVALKAAEDALQQIAEVGIAMQYVGQRQEMARIARAALKVSP